MIYTHFTNDCIIFLKSCFLHVKNKESLIAINEIDYKFLKRVSNKFKSEGLSVIDSKTFNQAFAERYFEMEKKYKLVKVKRISIASDLSYVMKIEELKKQKFMTNIELEILEASNFIAHFSNNFTINLEQMMFFFRNIKLMKKKRIGKKDKKYPQLMQIINVGKFDKVIQAYDPND